MTPAIARDLGANAVTVGSDVGFWTAPSLRLAAHEAAHVVQQRAGLRLGTHADEVRANAIAARVVTGSSAADLLPPSSVSRGSSPIQYEKATAATATELDEYFSSILDYWEQEAATRAVGPDRAEARRIVLLLSFPPEFTSYDEADAFLADCLATAKNEDKTVERLKQEPSVELEYFTVNGDAFPKWWAERIKSELYGTSSEAVLERNFLDARKAALANTALLSDEVWDKGLPLTKQQAASLVRSSIPDLALSFENAQKYRGERIGNFARLAITWERTLAHLMLVRWFRFQLGVRLDLIRKGDLVIDEDTWNNVLATKVFNVKLRVFEAAASRPDDMRAAFSALMLQLPNRFFRDPGGSGLKYDFRDEAVAEFWKEIREVDRRIAGTSTAGRVWQSWTWAYERGYFGEAAREMYESVKDDWPWMLARLIAVFVAQFIPGVNIAVDILLLIEFGFDGITAFLDLVDLVTSATNARSVEDLEHAAAKMASALAGVALKVVKWALTAGMRWSAKQLAKYQEGKQFLDEHGDTRENRELLSKAGGDAKEARKLLTAKRERELRAREEAAAEAKRVEAKKQRDKAEAERQQREREDQERARREHEQQERARQQEEEQRAADVERKRAERKAAKDDDLRRRREEHPDWPVVGKKPIKPYIATRTHYQWINNDGNLIDAKFQDGVLSVTLKARGNPKARGTDLLTAAFNHFGPDRIHAFSGLWVRGTDFEDNLNAYLAKLGGRHADAAARIEAAKATWTGRQMLARGFTNVTVPAHGPDPKEVMPWFSK